MKSNRKLFAFITVHVPEKVEYSSDFGMVKQNNSIIIDGLPFGQDIVVKLPDDIKIASPPMEISPEALRTQWIINGNSSGETAISSENPFLNFGTKEEDENLDGNSSGLDLMGQLMMEISKSGNLLENLTIVAFKV